MVMYGHELAAEACFSGHEFVMLVLLHQCGKVRLLRKLRNQLLCSLSYSIKDPSLP
jgi:hypothetical protein